MYQVEIAEVKPNEENVAELIRVRSSRKSYFTEIADAVMHIKSLVKQEPAPPNTFFKIHGNGSVAYADAFGEPLPLKKWEQFAPAFCEARNWIYEEERMQF